MRLYFFGVLFVLLSSRAFCETLYPNQENRDSFYDTSSASDSYEEDEDEVLSGQINEEQEYPNLYSGEEAPRDYQSNAHQSIDENVAYWQSIYGTEDVPEFEVPPTIDGDTIFLDLGDLTDSSDDEEAIIVKRNSGKASPDYFHGSSPARETQSLDNSWRSGNLDYRGMMTNVHQPQFYGENSWPDPKTFSDFQSDENEQFYGTRGASSFSDTNQRGSSWAPENFGTINSGGDSEEIDGEMETAETRSFRMNNKAVESLLSSKRKVIQAKKDLINVAVSGGSKAELSHALDKTIEAKQGLIDEVISAKADGNFKQRKQEFLHSVSGFDHAQSFSKNTKISGSQSANFRSVLDSKRKVIQAKKDLIHAAAAGSSKAQLTDAVVKTLNAKKDLVDSMLYNSAGIIHKKNDIAHSTCCKAQENFFGGVHRKQGISLNTDTQINGQIHTDLESGFSHSLNQHKLHAAELSSGVAYHDEKNSLQSSVSGASNIGVGAGIGVTSSSGNNIHKEGSSLNLSKNIQSNSQISGDLQLGTLPSLNLHPNNLGVSKNSEIGISSGITTLHDQQSSLHSSLNGASNIGVQTEIGATSSSGHNFHEKDSSLNLHKNIRSDSQISSDLELGTLPSLNLHQNNLDVSKNSGIVISSGVTTFHDHQNSLHSSLNGASNIGVESETEATSSSGHHFHEKDSSLNLHKNIQSNSQISGDLQLGTLPSLNLHKNDLAVSKNSGIGISSGITTVHDQKSSLHSSLDGVSNIEVAGDIGVTSSVSKNIHERQDSSLNLNKNIQSNSKISSDIQMGSVTSHDLHRNDLAISKNSEIGISSGITTVHDQQSSLHSSLNGASNIGVQTEIGATSSSGHNFHEKDSSLNFHKNIQSDSQISSDLELGTLPSLNLHQNNLAVSKNSGIVISSGVTTVHDHQNSLHSSLNGASNIGVESETEATSSSGHHFHEKDSSLNLHKNIQSNSQISGDLQLGTLPSLNLHKNDLAVSKNSGIGISSGITTVHDQKSSLHSSLDGASNIEVAGDIGVTSSVSKNIHEQDSSLNLNKNIQSNGQISSDIQMGSVTSHDLHRNNLAISKNSEIGISSGITTVHDHQNSFHSSLNGASNIGVQSEIGVTSSSGHNFHEKDNSVNLHNNIQSNNQISSDLHLGSVTSQNLHQNNLAVSKNSGIEISSGVTPVHDHQNSLHSSLNAASNIGVESAIGATSFLGKNIHNGGSSLNLSKKMQSDSRISSDLRLESSSQSEIDSLESSDEINSDQTESSEIKFNGATNTKELEFESSDSDTEEIYGSLSASGEIQSSNEHAGSSNFNHESKTHASGNSEIKTSLSSEAALSTNLGIGSLVHSDFKIDGKIGVGLSDQLNTHTAKTVEEKLFIKPEENVETEWKDNSKSIHKDCTPGMHCGISGKLHVDLNSENENSYERKNRLETITEQDVSQKLDLRDDDQVISYEKSEEYSTSEDSSVDLEANKHEETREDVSRTISVTKNVGIHVDHDVVSDLSLTGNRESISSLKKSEENRSSHKEAFGNFDINSDHDLKTRIAVHKELEHPKHSDVLSEVKISVAHKTALKNQEDGKEATDQNSRYQVSVNFDNHENNSDHEHQSSTYEAKFGKHYSNAAHQHQESQNTKTLSHFQSCFHEYSPFPEDVEYYDTDQTFPNSHCRLIDLDVNCSGMTAFMRPECQQLNANIWHPQESGAPITLWTVKRYLNHGQELAIEMQNRAKWLCGQGLIPKLHTPAMLHLINNLATENTVGINHESEVSLFGTKLLQQRLSSDFAVTPNTFVEFLQHHSFRVIGAGLCQARSKRCPSNQIYRSFDGSCNNQKHPTWGQCNTAFARILPARYSDGVHEPPKSVTGIKLPNPRALSVHCFSRKLISDRRISLAVSQWGQILSHDFAMQTIDQTVEGGIECCADGKRQLPKKYQHHSCLPIDIPEDDGFYSKFQIRCMNFVRSMTICREDCTLGPADQLNTVTSYLDASPLYGSNKETCDQLRAFEGGRMLVAIRRGRELLPITTNRSRFCDVMSPTEVCYRAGDVRVNQNPQLAILQTSLLREHNRIADALSGLNPHWNDERVFQESRRIVIAEYQHITYNEWVPLVIGKKYCQIHRLTSACRNKMSKDYDPMIKAATINSFTTAAFRFFHSMVDGNINLCPANREISHTLRLSNHFFRPQIIERNNNLDDLIRGLVSQPMLRPDENFHPEITEYLFRSRNEFGLDLEAMDIQRGRDHGLPGYNSYRKICGLKRARDFDDLIREIPQEKIEKLKKIYAHVDDIDLIVGSTMERKTSGSILGPTVRCLLGEQFYRSKIGDRYFYDNADQPHSFTRGQFQEIAKASFARLLCDTGDNVEEIQARAFELPSDKNPLKLCCALPKVDLSLWKESR